MDNRESYVSTIAAEVPEIVEERDDPLAHIIYLKGSGLGTLMISGLPNLHYCGCFKLRRAFRILEQIKAREGANYYIQA